MSEELADDALAGLQRLIETPEELDPELAAYLDTSELGFTMIRHPLVYSVVHHNALNALVNRQLRGKKEAVAEARREQNWSRYIYLHERPYRIDAFTNICWQLGDTTYWRLLGSIWTDTENLWQNRETWEECLTAERRYRSHMMSDDERDRLRHCYQTPIPVYRGFSGLGSAQGLSWTANPIVARFFARRFTPPGQPQYLAAGWVRKRDVIAFFDGRSETEMVVLPQNVRELRVEALRKEDNGG